MSTSPSFSISESSISTPSPRSDCSGGGGPDVYLLYRLITKIDEEHKDLLGVFSTYDKVVECIDKNYEMNSEDEECYDYEQPKVQFTAVPATLDENEGVHTLDTRWVPSRKELKVLQEKAKTVKDRQQANDDAVTRIHDMLVTAKTMLQNDPTPSVILNKVMSSGMPYACRLHWEHIISLCSSHPSLPKSCGITDVWKTLHRVCWPERTCPEEVETLQKLAANAQASRML